MSNQGKTTKIPADPFRHFGVAREQGPLPVKQQHAGIDFRADFRGEPREPIETERDSEHLNAASVIDGRQGCHARGFASDFVNEEIAQDKLTIAYRPAKIIVVSDIKADALGDRAAYDATGLADDPEAVGPGPIAPDLFKKRGACFRRARKHRRHLRRDLQQGLCFGNRVPVQFGAAARDV